jgi:hypothetical protein
MMRSSVMLDRGGERMLIYPETRFIDSRGNSVVGPSAAPVTRWVNIVSDRQSDAELTGQVAVKVIKFATRTIPGADSQCRVWFREEWWDLALPPKVNRVTRALAHGEYVLRSRNQTLPRPETL